MSEEHTEAIQAMEAPTVEQLEAELKKEQYRHNYGRVLRSTAFSLLVVAAVAVLVAVLLLPVLQINGTAMTEALQEGDVAGKNSNAKFKNGAGIPVY